MVQFERWYSEQYERTFKACVALCGEVDIAREATDEAFARAFERWSRVALMPSPGGWVQTVALNCMRRTLRRRARIPRHSSPGSVQVDLVDADVWAAVRQLPPRQQEVIVLRYVHDLTEECTAQVLGVSRGAVSASLSAARKTLRPALGESEEERHRG